MGTFYLNNKEGLELKRQLSKNEALKVKFIRTEDHWNLHLSYSTPGKEVSKGQLGQIGVDINNGHLDAAMTRLVNGKLKVIYKSYTYDTKADKHTRQKQIYVIINEVVAWAKANDCGVTLEYLDFEVSKKYLNSKLGALLHTLPYKKIRYKFERSCHQAGVALGYVKSSYTSLLGNLIASDNCNYSRDVAAAIVIALRNLKGGNTYLNKLSQNNRKVIRLNVKGKCGLHVRCKSLLDKIDTSDYLYARQNAAGSSIKKVADTLSGVYYRNKWLRSNKKKGAIRTQRTRLNWEVDCRSEVTKYAVKITGSRGQDGRQDDTIEEVRKLNKYFTRLALESKKSIAN